MSNQMKDGENACIDKLQIHHWLIFGLNKKDSYSQIKGYILCITGAQPSVH